MADVKALPNLQAPSRSPSLAQTLPSEAVLDALILLDTPLNEVLTSVTRLIEAHSEGMSCSIFLLEEDGLHLRYAAALTCPRRTGQRLMECALVLMSDRAAQPLTFESPSSFLTWFLTRVGRT